MALSAASVHVMAGRSKARAHGLSNVKSQDYPNCVEFLFVRTGVLNGEGQKTRQEGKEWICFTPASSTDAPPAISRVIVETFSTEVCPSA